MLKKYFPEDYEKVIKQYPFAEAGVLREEVYGEKQISGV
jgi:hypothetical protein